MSSRSTRAFDYSVPEAMAGAVRVGTIVRVGLHGRRVRGWVVDDDVESEVAADGLRPLLAVVSVGPPAPVVELSAWVAHRYCGSRVALLRSASPPNVVHAVDEPAPAERCCRADGRTATRERDALALAAEVRSESRRRAAMAAAARPARARRARSSRTMVRASSSWPTPHADAAWCSGCAARARARCSCIPSCAAAERSRAWAAAAAGRIVVVGGRVAALSPGSRPARARSSSTTPTRRCRKSGRRRGTRAKCSPSAARCAGARFAVVSAAPSVEAEVLAGSVHAPARAVEAAGWPRVERRRPPRGAAGRGIALGTARGRAARGARRGRGGGLRAQPPRPGPAARVRHLPSARPVGPRRGAGLGRDRRRAHRGSACTPARRLPALRRNPPARAARRRHAWSARSSRR